MLAATPRPPRRLLGLLLALLLLAQIDQPYPAIAPLQHIPTALLLLLSTWLLRRWPLSTPALLCIVMFLALHTLGGRYTYSNVPYDDWARSEEKTSELQSLMRNSYAVLCLKTTQ